LFVTFGRVVNRERKSAENVGRRFYHHFYIYTVQSPMPLQPNPQIKHYVTFREVYKLRRGTILSHHIYVLIRAGGQ